MNDAEKLNLIADWFDVEQDKGRWDRSRQVQADLRSMAVKILRIGGYIPDIAEQPVEVELPKQPLITSDGICTGCGKWAKECICT